MGSTAQYSIAFLPPPGTKLTRPTPSNPAPPSNPPIFNDAMHVRTVVFVDEQGCAPENEMDEDDPRSWHWVLYTEGENRAPIGTIRVVAPPHAPHEGHSSHTGASVEAEEKEEEPHIRLTRVAILAEYRRSGFGRILQNTALEWAAKHPEELTAALDGNPPWNGLTLVHAQVQAEGMYARVGFVTDESMGTWEDEGIMHVGMWKRIEVGSESKSEKQ
ncbi:hypothetical protein FQN55_002772 [Onygenales sp. PD_40]|nr:hypothetical protein FQN55_002772 [Onygenales sp. PD_40]KAK2783454.1 hypothetical protein FQN53_009217 [Emmonsiellopsis sp. PD_33]KAK2793416.1 hypothetical protein FQN52_001553 [Onygenales sp. PD_12]KAK2801348.1 hypothetical protein FQN51_005448 [Onygenales sp. PD_10]